MQKKRKTHKLILWHALALVGVLLGAPNGTMVKIITEDLDPLWIGVYRFGIVALILLPAVLIAWRRFNRKNLLYSLVVGLAYAVAVITSTVSIHLSQASYVAIISLAIPILLMLFSARFMREKISRKSYIGISIAALGGFSIIAAPVLLGGGLQTGEINVLATVLAFINCLAFPFIVIYGRKANESGLNIWATIGSAAIIAVVISVIIALLFGAGVPTLETIFTPHIFWLMLASAVGVTLLSRLVNIITYEHVGSAIVAALHYFENFLAIILPILILGELLTIEMVVGGFLILIGVLIIETRHHPHLHAHRRHHRHTGN